MADGNPTVAPLGGDVFEDDLDTRTAHARDAGCDIRTVGEVLAA